MIYTHIRCSLRGNESETKQAFLHPVTNGVYLIEDTCRRRLLCRSVLLLLLLLQVVVISVVVVVVVEVVEVVVVVVVVAVVVVAVVAIVVSVSVSVSVIMIILLLGVCRAAKIRAPFCLSQLAAAERSQSHHR